jgi:hypothetical protein
MNVLDLNDTYIFFIPPSANAAGGKSESMSNQKNVARNEE